MLSHFNGAELYVRSMLTIFGVSTLPPLPPLEWAEDWYIDKYTDWWRSHGNGNGNWVFAIWNYGGLMLMDQDGWTTEWDTNEQSWGPRQMPFEEWIEFVFHEGDAYLNEQ